MQNPELANLHGMVGNIVNRFPISWMHDMDWSTRPMAALSGAASAIGTAAWTTYNTNTTILLKRFTSGAAGRIDFPDACTVLCLGYSLWASTVAATTRYSRFHFNAATVVNTVSGITIINDVTSQLDWCVQNVAAGDYVLWQGYQGTGVSQDATTMLLAVRI